MPQLKDALRQILHRRAVSLTIVATLALGIGANALVFSAVRGVLLEPLPFPEPAQLVNVWETQPGNDTRAVAPANFLDWRADGSFDGLAAYNRRRRSLAGDTPVHVTVATVSANFFRVLGVQALAGRTFTSVIPEGASREVVLREDFWRGRFAADPALIGRAIRLDDETLVVAGVVPTALGFPEDAVAWTQAPHDVPELGAGAPKDLRGMRDAWYFRVVGRLKAGVTREQAQAEMDAVARRLQHAYPATNREAGIRLVDLQEQLTGSTAPMLWMLLGVVACMLAIACANVATLLLASAIGRTRELAIRAALGATRGRLVQQLCAESLLLSLGGGAIGLGAAWLGRPALLSLLPAGTPRAAAIDIDLSVAGFTLALSVITSLVFGVAPALLASRAGFGLLRNGGRSGPSPRRARTASLLVAAQLAAALVLVTGTGLMLRTIWTLYQRDVGIDVERLLALDVTLPDARSRGRAAAALDFAHMAERLAAVPGVTAAGAIQSLPLSGGGASAALRVEGRTFGPDEAPDVAWRAITPGYFDTVGARILRGRGFTAADREGAQPVAIINGTLARRLWPDGGAIGAGIGTGLDGTGAGVTVVGIVEDIPQDSLHARVQPEMYRPLAQPSRFSTDAMSLVVRTDGNPASLTSAAREAIRQVHPRAPVAAARTMAAVAAAGVATEISVMRALGIFGGLALVLAAVGLHGVVARQVADRRRELGVRMALGASPRNVRWLVLGQTLKLALAGVGAGAAASVVLSQQLGALLHGVSGADPLVFTGAAAVLLCAALAAGYLPARNASRIDPVSVMKAD